MERPLVMWERIKGAWSKEEDDLLRDCIQRYGEGKWHLVPQRAGLKRCRKSCRLRWMNYLKPDIKRGNFTQDEIDMIIRFQRLLGNRWSLIAARFPGRTSNDVKNLYNTYIKKRQNTYNSSHLHHHGRHININEDKHEGKRIITKAHHQVIKPQPLSFSKTSSFFLKAKLPVLGRINHNNNNNNNNINNNNNNYNNNDNIDVESKNYNSDVKVVECEEVVSQEGSEKSREWWESLVEDVEREEESDRLWYLDSEKNLGSFSIDDFLDEQLNNYWTYP